jgi:hypothetical protein
MERFNDQLSPSFSGLRKDREIDTFCGLAATVHQPSVQTRPLSFKTQSLVKTMLDQRRPRH